MCGLSVVVANGGYSLVATLRLVVAFPVAEYRLEACELQDL